MTTDQNPESRRAGTNREPFDVSLEQKASELGVGTRALRRSRRPGTWRAQGQEPRYPKVAGSRLAVRGSMFPVWRWLKWLIVVGSAIAALIAIGMRQVK